MSAIVYEFGPNFNHGPHNSMMDVYNIKANKCLCIWNLWCNEIYLAHWTHVELISD